MSYVVTREHVLKGLSASLTEQMQPVEVKKPQAELMPYPAPPEEFWPYIPPPDYSHETPLPTHDLSILPTLAPTMNPLDD